MGDWACQFDMAHPFTPHFGERDLDTTFLTDHAAVLQSLVFAAKTLIVANRPEDLGAEQPITFRLEGPIVDGFRLLHLPKGPGANHVRRGEADTDIVEILNLILTLQITN